MSASRNGGHRDARTLVGAAAAAGEGAAAVPDPPPAPPPPGSPEREFRLHADETVADGIRRVARGQLADSCVALARAPGSDELAEAVHSTRKAIKRVRTTLRLSRDALGEGTYEREKARLKAIADELAGARDAHVLIETLAMLEDRADGAPWTGATGGLRARLRDDHGHAMGRLDADGEALVAARQALEDARARTADWHFAHDDFEAVTAGVRRIYRQGRRRMRAAAADPTPEHLHDARKRVKDLWHSAQLLRPAAPKQMKRLARDAHALSDLLGDHHDLSVLRACVERNTGGIADMASRDELLAALDGRRDALARRALKLGGRVYKRAPKRFVTDVARGWDKRVATPARPPAC